ncbi:MAG: hypothetical protein ACWA6U_07250 [Breznakibacter sp.]
MQTYLSQLLDDLATAAKNPPAAHYYDSPPHLEEDRQLSELAMVPYRTIEQLSGIKQEMFPLMTDLDVTQCQEVNQAIFKLFEALHIELVDMPSEIPPEWLYEVLTTNWLEYVQYLPSSGMDLELCTGDPQTCPYGEYCDCGEDYDIYELPDRFASMVNRLTQMIGEGQTCLLNTATLEIVVTDNPSKKGNEEDWIAIHPLDGKELLRIMNSYRSQLNDNNFVEELACVLGSSNPTRDFEAILQHSHYADHWHDFLTHGIKDHVRWSICLGLNKNARAEDNDELPF